MKSRRRACHAGNALRHRIAGRSARTIAIIGVALVPILAALAQALPSTLVIAEFERGDWRASGIRLELDPVTSARRALRLHVARLAVPALDIDISDLAVRCGTVKVARAGINCDRGGYTMSAGGRVLDGALTLVYSARSGELSVALALPGLPDNQVTATTGLRGKPALSLRADGLDLVTLMPILQRFYPGLADYSVAGGQLDVTLNGDSAGGYTLAARVAQLAASNEAGTIASEALAGSLNVIARPADDGAHWRGDLTLEFADGGVYAEPVYLDLAQHPLEFTAGFELGAEPGSLRLPHFTLVQREVVTLAGELLSTSDARLKMLRVEVAEVLFPAVYDTWLAGALVGTPLATLDTGGSASGAFAFADDALDSLQVRLDGLNLEDRQARFALYRVAGEVNWAAQAQDLDASRISIGGGFVYNAGFDATTLELGIAGAAIDLLEPARIPLLGGALALDTFTLRDYGTDELSLGLEATLEPIDLGQLTVALNWPAFAGELSGRLPLLRYQGGVVTVGGALEAQAFDGDISIENLRVEQPFGLVPVITTSVRLRGLDLEQVTEVVPFGRVSGRLDGDIDNLRLVKGEPVWFDASFRTPAGDTSRRRLSQRAVDTISRVAGGGAALSSTFLRVFKHFAYDKLGISCRLENDICHMDGVEQADDGYYIVKGALIPRVDLIGRVRRVRWSRLMQQLERALNEGELRVE